MDRIGLVAGSGRLPLIFASAAKSRGDTVIAFGLKGITDDSLESRVDKMHWMKWGSLQKGVFLMMADRIKKVVLLGSLKKDVFFSVKETEGFDKSAQGVLDSISDRKDYSLFNGVNNLLSKFGVQMIDPTEYLNELFPPKGTVTKKEPSRPEWEDINYGREVARELARFDIGQTVAVKQKTVIALEAMEGTDETIKRAGQLAKSGFVTVKVARPDQDMRFDIPLVGLDTVKLMAECGGTALAMEEKKTLLMDREEIVRFAEEKNLSIVVI